LKSVVVPFLAGCLILASFISEATISKQSLMIDIGMQINNFSLIPKSLIIKKMETTSANKETGAYNRIFRRWSIMQSFFTEIFLAKM
jgi:hypothetical protein